MEEYEVQGANDPAVSSRDKDRLFADEPRQENQPMDDGERALAEHKAAVQESADGDADTANLDDSVSRARERGAPQPAEGMLAQPVPERHVHTAYEEDVRDATVDDADFEAEETNKKDGTA